MTHTRATAGAGRLYLVPNALDFGIGAAAVQPALDAVVPIGVIRVAARLRQWVCEDAKSTRAFLKRVDALVSLDAPLQTIAIRELPRPVKGSAQRSVDQTALQTLLTPALEGEDIGLLSEAGLPAVADPGSSLVEAAHRSNIEVVALPGASSLLLALAASGLYGQSFAFVGYLPTDPGERTARIRELEALSRRSHQTQLMIETPYRNQVLLTALLNTLQPETRLSISCGLTLENGYTRSRSVAEWKLGPHQPMPDKLPAVFSLLARA